MIKAIIFDCFGVLTTDLWREFIDTLPPSADIDRARELNHQYDAGLLTIEQFLNQVEEATGHRPVEVEKLLDNEATKNTALLTYITELKRDYKIGMLSNIATNWVREKFLTHEEQSLFDDMVFSFEVGTTKPDPLIYTTACERLGVQAQETVFIDDIADYCQAAHAAGLQTVHYRHFQQMKAELEQILAQK